MSESINLSRKELVYLTKLSNKCKQLDEAIIYSIKFVEANPILTKDERKIFVCAFKNSITKKRASWRILTKKENEEKDEEKKELIRELKYNVESEIKELIGMMINIIEEYIIGEVKDNDNAVFYSKLKADYLRYYTELLDNEDEEKINYIEETDNAYKISYEIADKNLSVISSTKLGLVLNYSVFLWEIKKSKQEAALLAKTCFDQVYEKFQDLEQVEDKESLLLVQLLRENLMMWSKDPELLEDDYEDDEKQMNYMNMNEDDLGEEIEA